MRLHVPRWSIIPDTIRISCSLLMSCPPHAQVLTVKKVSPKAQMPQLPSKAAVSRLAYKNKLIIQLVECPQGTGVYRSLCTDIYIYIYRRADS